MKEHNLKIWPSFFEAIESGDKTFEYRKNDRDFAVGDYICLNEFDPGNESYTGRSLGVRIIYILQGQMGIPENYCIMSIEKVKNDW